MLEAETERSWTFWTLSIVTVNELPLDWSIVLESLANVLIMKLDVSLFVLGFKSPFNESFRVELELWPAESVMKIEVTPEVVVTLQVWDIEDVVEIMYWQEDFINALEDTMISVGSWI